VISLICNEESTKVEDGGGNGAVDHDPTMFQFLIVKVVEA